jgi:hypothetical protein
MLQREESGNPGVATNARRPENPAKNELIRAARKTSRSDRRNNNYVQHIAPDFEGKRKRKKRKKNCISSHFDDD